MLEELRLRIPIITGIPDFLNCIPDSKSQDSGFHKQKFLSLPWLQNSRFFLKISKEIGKESCAREAREPGVSPQSRSLFSASF